MRFSSQRDFSRALERALRRAEVPMAYSAGFHPHPKISYVNAAPTGVASEAEYLEIALAATMDPEVVRARLDEVLPDGLDMLAAIDAVDCPPGSLAERMQASLWRIELGDPCEEVAATVARLLAAASAPIERLTKDGKKTVDVRAPIVSARVSSVAGDQARAILELVVKLVTPTVRPDDVIAALDSVAGFAPSQPIRATRLAQGPIGSDGVVSDPLSTTPLVKTGAPGDSR